MIRQRLRLRYGVLLAYLLAGGVAHVIAGFLNGGLLEKAILTGLFCAVVQTVYGREWWR